MKIKYLGTAAAEAFPALFCDCENCRKAGKSGGRNIRSRSQTLIDDGLLIDYPADSYYHFEINGLNWLDIKNCLITHVHSDHFYVKDFECSLNGCSHPPKGWHGFKLWGSCDLKEPLENMLKTNNGFFSYGELKAFEKYLIDGYTVTPLKANHGTENPFVYIIEKDGKTLFYAHDTGVLPQETVDYIAKSDLHFDLVSLDCTEGAYDDLPYEGHQCLGFNINCRNTLKEIGAANDSTVFVLNHFSHNGLNSAYDDFKPFAEKESFTVSYDGMELEF